MNRKLRVSPPPSPSPNNPLRVPDGRQYFAGPGVAYLDMADVDAFVARSNGWQVLGYVGTTAERPRATDPDGLDLSCVGVTFIDLTLGRVVIWDQRTGGWIDAITGLTT